ncbi:ExbD/TolR family protein [Aliikangiella maris]|uniref:Biopolymer transporter ExbD n=2 Tax=Aliikangiella maris TaxID=3162458 RepID=A0ABV3MI37_9GAMM
MFRRKSKKLRENNAELNITAFMNLMVVLVPFLLITAVFSQISILNLNLPAGVSEDIPSEEKPPKALEVVIRKDKFDVMERNSGLLKRIINTENGYDFQGLNTFLQTVKAHPEFNIDTSVTLLMEMDTSYDTLVQTMDAVRLIVREERELDEKGNLIQGELFPNISMGDAPPETDNSQTQLGTEGSL